MNVSRTEVLILKEGEELRLSGDGTIRIAGGVKNPLPGQATVVLLFIQPNQHPAVKSVNVEIKRPGIEKEKNGDNNMIPLIVRGGENLFATPVTIKIMREDNDGMLTCDVFTI